MGTTMGVGLSRVSREGGSTMRMGMCGLNYNKSEYVGRDGE